MRFHPDWKSSLFVVLMLPVLIGLGFWQLERAQEKRDILAAQQRLTSLPPVAFDSLASAENFTPVFVTGRFDQERYFLLDNRINNGKYGFNVVQVFTTESGQELLVDRGWLPGDVSRRSLPDVNTPNRSVTLVGEVWRPSKAFTLGEDTQAGWPKLVQALDSVMIETMFGQPYIMRLAAGQPSALHVDRAAVNQSPAKHTGYAVQWFVMAFALVTLFLYRNVSKV